MDEETYKIGELADIFGLTVESLRYYEKLGIIHSERKENNYRMFDEEQICTMTAVASMRKADVPLANIQKFVSSTDLTEILVHLSFAEKRLDNELALILQKKRQVEVLRSLWERIQNIPGEISLRQSPYWQIQVEHTRQASTKDAAFLVKADGQGAVYKLAWIIAKEQFQREEFGYARYAIVTENHIVDATMTDQIIPSRLCAYMLFNDERQKKANAYRELYRWINSNGYRPSDDIIETYLVSNSKRFALEIWVPVEKRESLSGQDTDVPITP